ncbi:hypothetical protein PH586_22545 [Pseudomonas sp. SA3-5]|uniref:Uncharacterized protein n=1 Tax=Pseudomonas aestuarii TaxID=3018340 RepID=A0ABT4XLT9_9PSED|nr:hypothetical protein [Pseudomonas aestuarii]MDA7089163.1 hypothetical protein [Pseudomonas aestuarii]
MSKITRNPRPLRPLRERALRQLAKDKLLAITADGPRTTARWQAAVMRVIGELMQDGNSVGEENQDLRIPFAKALNDLYAGQRSEDELTEMVLLMLEVETAGWRRDPSHPRMESGEG